MGKFSKLIKFTAPSDSKSNSGTEQHYFAELPKDSTAFKLEVGASIVAYTTIEDLENKLNPAEIRIGKLLPPLPQAGLPIYCVGLNYRSHATEAKLSIPKYPPLWTKPAASLASPQETISLNQFCALSLPDYEGELVFVTSRDCKDIRPDEAESYILGYTMGNDLSCRFFQLQSNSGGQFFYAKAFDKFAPIGPVLVSSEDFHSTSKGRRLKTSVNGNVVQNVEIAKDMIFSPAQILSHMSQGTTIPAGTAVMTGTPAGVGAFRVPKSFLQDGDVVEIEIDGIGKLSNTIKFTQLSWWVGSYLKLQTAVLWVVGLVS